MRDVVNWLSLYCCRISSTITVEQWEDDTPDNIHGRRFEIQRCNYRILPGLSGGPTRIDLTARVHERVIPEQFLGVPTEVENYLRSYESTPEGREQDEEGTVPNTDAKMGNVSRILSPVSVDEAQT